MPDMYLVCGMSGSGKTTFAKKMEKLNNARRLGIDDFYAKVNGDECHHYNKFEVWIEFFKAIHEAQEKKENIIIDTNALTYAQRAQFVDWFPGFTHHLIFLITDHDLRKKNNKSRRRQIPDEIMDSMALKEEIPTPTLDKEWDTITYIFNTHNHFEPPVFIKGRIELEGL